KQAWVSKSTPIGEDEDDGKPYVEWDINVRFKRPLETTPDRTKYLLRFGRSQQLQRQEIGIYGDLYSGNSFILLLTPRILPVKIHQ
ncbi:hypothetical protein VN97_g5677, partial [Penicillium thymicola]